MLKKYEFTDLAEFQGLINGKKLFNTPIILGHKLIEEGEYDDEDNIIKEPIYNDRLMIDIYWESNEDSSFLNAHEIFPNNPVHKIF